MPHGPRPKKVTCFVRSPLLLDSRLWSALLLRDATPAGRSHVQVIASLR